MAYEADQCSAVAPLFGGMWSNAVARTLIPIAADNLAFRLPLARPFECGGPGVKGQDWGPMHHGSAGNVGDGSVLPDNRKPILEGLTKEREPIGQGTRARPGQMSGAGHMKWLLLGTSEWPIGRGDLVTLPGQAARQLELYG